MADNKISEMIRNSLESIRSVADSSTIIGDPISTNNGTVIIPVSKISIGFASGGLDYLPKSKEEKESSAKAPAKTTAPCFSGGGGTGISITPVCFIVVKEDGAATMLSVGGESSVSPAAGVVNSVSSFADKLPDIIERLKNTFSKKKTEDGLDDEELAEAISELDKLDA